MRKADESGDNKDEEVSCAKRGESEGNWILRGGSGNWFQTSEKGDIHCVSKKHPRCFSYNSRKHCRIFIIFGRNITKKASDQKMLYFSTSPN